MSDHNSLSILGRLTKDVTLEKTRGGTSVAKFSIANNYYLKGKDAKETVSFFDLVAFGKSAETIAEWMKKGSQILIDGEIRQDRWTKEGKTHSRVYIVVNRFQFVGGKREDQSAGGPPPAHPADNGPSHGGPSEGNEGASGFSDDEVPF